MRDASRGIWTAWLDELPQQCVEDAAKLLSSHWKRSTTSRIASLRWGGREGREARERKIGTNGLETVLPRSLVLCMPGGCGAGVEEEQRRPRIIGHARLKRCSFELGATAVLVESVLIEVSLFHEFCECDEKNEVTWMRAKFVIPYTIYSNSVCVIECGYVCARVHATHTHARTHAHTHTHTHTHRQASEGPGWVGYS
jgi:hypothetical protein